MARSSVILSKSRKHIMLSKYIFILSSLSFAYYSDIGDPRYLGCYNYEEPILSGREIYERYITISLCIDRCRWEGYAYAGLRAGHDCYCGRFGILYGKYGKVSDHDCIATCSGDSNERCGGYDTISVYRACEKYKFGEHCEKHCLCSGGCDSVRVRICRHDEACPWGSYGYSCKYNCPHCKDYQCDPINGTCESCPSGYTGETCEELCPFGTYGDDCKNSCPRCRQDKPCHHIDGTCEPCPSGYTGETCDEFCPSGSYGLDCKFSCPRCREDICNPIDGTCESCPSGYTGKTCDEFCPPGSYGDDCKNSCPPCREDMTCHHINGTCEACASGLRGEKCDEYCPAGSYGYGCYGTCTWQCANNVTCNALDGSCPDGKCQEGFIGSRCEIPKSKSIKISGGVKSVAIISLMVVIAL